MKKLTVMAINKSLPAGRYGDGNGLYLLVGPTGGKSWVFRFKVNNRERAMGLGPFPLVTLAEARGKALELRKVRASGEDPLALRDQERTQKVLADRKATSFRDCAELYLETHEVAWKNAKHRQQWRSTLHTPILKRDLVLTPTQDVTRRRSGQSDGRYSEHLGGRAWEEEGGRGGMPPLEYNWKDPCLDGVF